MYLPAYLCAPHVYRSPKLEEGSEAMELEVVNCHVGAGNQPAPLQEQ